MNRKRSMLIAGLTLVVALPAAAEKAATVPDLSSFPFWTLKGNSVRPFIPGLNGALLLSDEQKVKLEAARAETIGSEASLKAGRLLKTGATATEAERQAARETVETLKTRFRDQVASILSPEQKALIPYISDIYAAVSRDVQGAAAAAYAASKPRKAQLASLTAELEGKTRTEFRARLKQALTTEQWQALESAAAAELAAEAAAATKKAAR